MADQEHEANSKQVEVECPKCHHKFWHNIVDALKGALDGLGNAIGEAKFGGQ